MKIIKGLGVLFIAVCFGSCFDPPQFPSVPEIKFNDIVFIDDPSTPFDSLVISIDFKDGDGDLGIDPENPQFRSNPFNSTNYFQENNGQLEKLFTRSASSATEQYEIIEIPDPNNGKLVTFRTRLNPVYSTKLPAMFHCSDYEVTADKSVANKPPVTGTKLLIEKSDYPALDPKVKIVDTLVDRSNPGGPIEYYQIKDTVYFEINPDHYNIEVDFLVKEPGDPNADENGFVEFNWFERFCQTFDGRFPYLTDNENSLEGTLSYAMISTGFNASFGSKTLKLRVTIKDRELHRSNTITTDEFDLIKIRKKR